MIKKSSAINLVKYFPCLKDPRGEHQKLHPLPDILFIVFCGAICGVETWEDGDYVLAVKGNQNKIHEQIPKHFGHLFDMEYNKYVNVSVMEDKSRGRIETRKCLAV